MSRTALATISSTFLLAGAAALPAAASTDSSITSADPTAPPRAIFVDDDRTECPDADFTSVQDAIQAASPGALVRVCPGVYTEFVNVDKPVRLLGQIGAVDNIDCFDPAASQPGDLDPTTYAVLNRPAGQRGNLLTVAAGGATVAGLVLQGATGESGTPNIADAAVHLTSGSAGTRVHHNLLRLNSLGIDLGSDGSATTRVDHNCLRGELAPNTPTRSTWGMASQRQDFVGGTVDHNETFGHGVFAYEVGWDFASTRQVVFADNVSRQDGGGVFANGSAFHVQNSSHVTIADNDIEPVRFGIRSVSGNSNLTITGNRIVDGSQIGVFFLASAAPTQTARVAGNTITDFGPSALGYGIGIASSTTNLAAVRNMHIEDNVVRGNVRGMSVNPNSTDVVVRANVATGNQTGIFALAGPNAESTYGYRFEQNTLLDNILVDARDDSALGSGGEPRHIWVDNVCKDDIPRGKICQPPPATP